MGGEGVSPLRGSQVVSAPGRCGVGMAAEAGTALGCPCPVVLTVPMLSPWAMHMSPGLSPEGTEIRDTGTAGCSRCCLEYKVSGLERE